MSRVVRLDEDFAGSIASAGTSGYLKQSLGEALIAAKIGAQQTLIRAQYADHGYARKIMPLGQHLRTDEDLRVALFDTLQHVSQLAFATCDVPVETRDPGLGE